MTSAIFTIVIDLIWTSQSESNILETRLDLVDFVLVDGILLLFEFFLDDLPKVQLNYLTGQKFGQFAVAYFHQLLF